MDTSTNWAVTMISTMTVFALSNQTVPHTFFLFLVFMVTVFLLMESRRYSLFAYSRNRVLMLERGFHARSLLHDVRSAATPAREIWPGENVRRRCWLW